MICIWICSSIFYMTECKVNEYYVENKQIFDLIRVSQAYFKDLFQEKIKIYYWRIK